MLTDAPPRKPNLRFFVDSDRLKTISLPDDGRLVKIADAIEASMKTEDVKDVRQVCDDFLGKLRRIFTRSLVVASACLRPDRFGFVSARPRSFSATITPIPCGSGSGKIEQNLEQHQIVLDEQVPMH